MIPAMEIPEGITREDVLDGIERFEKYGTTDFAESITYDLFLNGRRYPPKAILGLSTFRLLAHSLTHADFKGGEDSKCFRILRKLGFEIVPKASPRAWLEMARDPVHGGNGWEFGHAIWAPALKENGRSWAYWKNVERVKAGDVIVHLKGIGPEAAFVGSSIAAHDGGTADGRPPHPGNSAYAGEFLRVQLRDYNAFEQPIYLRAVFATKQQELRSYYERNAVRKGVSRYTLFYVI
ncbi:MAG: hypothetical protein EXS42_09810 [Lacunisphaera sp.]|nr:hypothetical protein [Lacunisphaera sp.]